MTRWIVCLVGVFAISALGRDPGAAQVIRAGVVTALHGNVTVTRTAAAPTGLRFRDDVFVSDRIATANRSMVRILMGGKAVLTVREHSVLTITEVPGTATIDLRAGGAALAVVHDRMRPGESIDIRTPNAIAGVRGTVLIAEVAGLESATVTSTFTVLRGTVEVRVLDAQAQPSGAGLMLTTLQAVGIRPHASLQPVTVTPEAARRLADDFKMAPGDPPGGARIRVTEVEIQEAIRDAAAFLGAGNEKNGPARDADASSATGRTELKKLERLLDLATVSQKSRAEDLRRIVPEEKRDRDLSKNKKKD